MSLWTEASRRLNGSRRRAFGSPLALGVALGTACGLTLNLDDHGRPAAVVAAPAETNPTVEAFRRAEFRIVAKQEELPPEIRGALAAYVKDAPVADPGRKWDSTDVLSDPPMPRRRLVLAGVGKNLAFVAYEHGGLGKHAHLMLLALDGSKATVSYACVGQPIVPVNLDGLRGAVRRKTCAPVTGVQEDEQ